MKVGDLVMFRNCAQEGMTGIISMLTEPSHVARENPTLRLYWVLCDTGILCFTGNQLRMV